MLNKQYFEDGKLVCQCSYDDKNRYHGDYKSWYTNGRLKTFNIYKFGTMLESKRYHDTESNLCMIEYKLVNGLKHGLCIVYYPDGSIHKKIKYSQGERVGPTRVYDENGNIIKQINYPTLTMGLGKLSFRELKDLCIKYEIPTRSSSKDRLVEYIDNKLKSVYV